LSFSIPGQRVLEEKQMKVFIADDSKAVVERLADLLEEVQERSLWDKQAMCRKPYAAFRR